MPIMRKQRKILNQNIVIYSKEYNMTMVQLAHARAMREEFVQPWDLEPIYLRKPDAEINWSTRNDSK